MAKEKAKHDGLLCFLLALIVVLILVIGGGAYYFLVVDNGEEIAEKKMENNLMVAEKKDDNVEENKTLKTQEEIDGLAKANLEKYLDIMNSKEASPISILERLGFYTYEEMFNKFDESKSFIETDIKYDSVKEKLLKFASEDIIEKNILNSNMYKKDSEGNILILNGGASGEEFEITRMILINKENDIYTYEICINDIVLSGAKIPTFCIVEFKNVNNNYVVSDIEYKRIEEVKINTLSSEDIKYFENYLNEEANGFIASNYETISEIDIVEAFYNDGDANITDAERKEYERIVTDGQEINIDVLRYTREMLEKEMKEKADVGLEGIQALYNEKSGWLYIEQYDAYYTCHSDALFLRVNVTSVQEQANVYTINYDLKDLHYENGKEVTKGTVKMTKKDGKYYFLSNKLV